MNPPQVSAFSSADLDSVTPLTHITCTNVDLNTELAKPYARVTVGRLNGVVGAYALTWSVADELQLIDLATLPEARRQGLARALLTELIAFGRNHKSQLCLLEVRESNRAALALYEDLGFVTTRSRRNYYSNGETAREMELRLA